MPQSIMQYDLLISCPGDIESELPLIKKVVDDFNSTFSDTLGITVRTKHWSKNSYAQSGGKPQALLNEQFVKDCDAAVALFWTRFGTPTDEYGSGTEEEIEIMLSEGKQVFMYFSDKAVAPSQHDPVQYAKVQAFRDKYKDRGIYFTYSSDEEFEKLFFAHLSQHFLAEKRVAEVRAERKSELCLKGIDKNGSLVDNAVFQKYELGLTDIIDLMIDDIKHLFHDISTIHVFAKTDEFWGFNKRVEIHENWISLINLMAEKLSIKLSDDFFKLGDLKESLTLAPSIFGESFEGSNDEKKKYSLIKALFLKIEELSNWLDVKSGFENISCIKLAISNMGTNVDEDIDVVLHIPKNAFMPLEELPTLTEDAMRFLSHDCDMQNILGISPTAMYSDYDSSMKKNLQPTSYRPSPVLPIDIDYEEDYRDELENVFCYDIFLENDYYVIKLKFDYIKHHTTVAFPAAILLKEKVDVIQYSITSKNSAEIICSEIRVD